MSGLFEELSWRGLIHQLTDEETLPKLLDGDPLVTYVGFDPTADSLHVGSLLQVCLLRRLGDAGHKPIALIGGATAMVGDPSGKTDERVLLNPGQLETNRAGIAAQLGRLLDFGPGGPVLEDNASWLGPVGLLEFLRDVGKLFSVNEMVRKESVRSRLEGREQGISFTEFSYMLLQAWDFLQLFDRYGCRLQVGGSDQWGNITEGVDLIRRCRETQAFGLTAPLITKADGTKFGKSEAGNIWLDARRTSPYEFFQFWLRTADADVGRYLRAFTFLDHATIEGLDLVTATAPERREAQRVLAREVTTAVHGEAEAAQAERASAALFTGRTTRSAPQDRADAETAGVAQLDEAAITAALAHAPSSPVTSTELDDGLPLVDALVRSGLASSRSDARRTIEGGGVYVNNQRQASDRLIGSADVIGRSVLLRRGKTHQHVLVVGG